MQRHRDRKELGVVKKQVVQDPPRSHEVQSRADMPSGVPSACKTSTCHPCNEPGSQAPYVKIKFYILVVASCILQPHLPFWLLTFGLHFPATHLVPIPLARLLLASPPQRTCNAKPSFCPTSLPCLQWPCFSGIVPPVCGLHLVWVSLPHASYDTCPRPSCLSLAPPTPLPSLHGSFMMSSFMKSKCL